MTTIEGCASVSNLEGDLLFYTDGTWVWDATHTVMPNGDSLLGNASSTQSAVVVPYPGDPDKFAIVAVRGCTGGSTTGQSGFYFSYSVVDMNLNGGLGDVITAQKNIILMDSSSEKCTAALHANGTDIWLIGREQDAAQFHAFRLTSSGVTDTVTSNIGFPNNCAGYLLANHDGDRLVEGVYTQNRISLFDFDQATGVISNADTLITPMSPYGVHFSPNDEILYAAGLGRILQYDLTAANIQASQYHVDSVQSLFFGALAEGPDERIYVARYGTLHIGCIEEPNQLGAACNFVDSAVFLLDRACNLGLPNHVAAGIFAIGNIQVEEKCVGDSTYFALDTTNLDSIFWNFGDPTSGPQNLSTLFLPSHLYTDTGVYTVTVIAYRDTLIDTAETTFRIYPRQTIDLGPDLLLCEGDTILLDITQDYADYLWSDASTSPTRVVTDDVVLWGQVNGVCDTVRDTVTYVFDDPIFFDFGPDTSFCDGNGLLLDANIQVTASYGWNTGDSTDNIFVTQTGGYKLTAINGCGEFSDSIYVEVIPNPDSTLLPPDTLNCFDNTIYLTRPLNDSITWLWSDSSDVEVFEVDTTMTVWLAGFNDCGFLIDTFTAIFNGEIQTELREDTVICDEDSIELFGTDTLATYVWNTGDTTDTVVTVPGVDQNYIVTITLRDCQLVEQKEVLTSDSACPDLDCALKYGNVFTPNGDGWNDRFRITSDCDVYSYDMAIYNRWGQLVHYSRNISYGWDGYVNGSPASPGVYFFTVEYKDFVVVDADRFATRGSFTLIR